MEKLKIAVWGDSIGAQPPAPFWPELCQRSIQCCFNPGRELEFINLSVCGRPAVLAKTLFDETVAPHRPDVVVLQFGYNDLRWECAEKPLGTVPEFEEAMEEMIRKSLSFGARVLVLGNHDPFCSGWVFPSGQTYPGAVAVYRDAAKRIAEKCGAGFINMAEAFRASGVDPVELTADGVHLSLWGKKVYAYTVGNYLISRVLN